MGLLSVLLGVEPGLVLIASDCAALGSMLSGSPPDWQ